MKVCFYAYYRNKEYAGCKEMEWPGEAGSLRGLLSALAERFGPKFGEELLSPDGNAIGERTIIMVNGRRAEFLDGIDTPLKTTDTVLVFPVVAGG